MDVPLDLLIGEALDADREVEAVRAVFHERLLRAGVAPDDVDTLEAYLRHEYEMELMQAAIDLVFDRLSQAGILPVKPAKAGKRKERRAVDNMHRRGAP